MQSTHRATRAALAAVATLVAVGLLAGCSSAKDSGSGTDNADTIPTESPLENVNLIVSDEPGAPGGKIVYGLNAETDGWNPTNSRWATSGLEVAKSIYDTLAAYDVDLGWQPNLAEAFTPNADYSQWVITLRPDVVFHNGKTVDAEAVAASLNAMADSPLTQQPFEPIESITPTGPLEVTVDMVETWVNFPYAMTTQIGTVPDPEWLASGDTRAPIGTGAFVFDSWETGRRLVVKKNQDYWRDGLPFLDEVEFIPYIDELTRSNALESGEIDIMIATTGTQIAKFKELAETTKEYQVVNDPSGETTEVMVMLNTKQPPLDNPDARRALAMATDPNAYIAQLGEGQFVPAEGPFAPSSPWYVPTEYPDYDPAGAAALVEQVKAANGGAFDVTIYSVPDANATAGVQLLQNQWRQAGVNVNVETLDQTQLIASVVSGQYQATLWTQFDSPHPLGDSIWWHPEASNPLGEFALNFARNENPEIGAKLDAARETTDRATEAQLYGEVSQLLAQDIPYIWLYHNQVSIVANNKLVNIVDYTLPNGVQGLPMHGGAHPLAQIWIQR